MRSWRSVARSPISSTRKLYGSMKSVELVTWPSAPPLQPRVDEDRRRPFVAFGEVGVERADLDDFAPRAPAQRVDGMAAGRQQVAAAAGASSAPSPIPDTSRSPATDTACARTAGRPSQPDVAQPVRELQVRVEAQLERNDRPHAGRADRVANLNQLLPRRARLASRGRCACLRCAATTACSACRWFGVAIEMMSTSAASSRSSYRVVSRASGSEILCFVERGPRPLAIAAVEPRHAHVRVLLEGGDVLSGAPADAGHAYAKFSITSRHWLSLD